MCTQMPKGDSIDSDVSLDAYFCSQPWFRYGGRAITEECPAAMILMCVQSIVGVIIQVGHFGFHHKPNAFIVFRPVWQALSLPSLWCQWAGVRLSCSPRSVPSLQSPYCTTAWILQNALITMRNGALYLLVRLADLRMKHLIECHVNGHFLMKVV